MNSTKDETDLSLPEVCGPLIDRYDQLSFIF